MERATEMANDVSQAAAYSKENERVNPPPVSQHKTIASSSRAALFAGRPPRGSPSSRAALFAGRSYLVIGKLDTVEQVEVPAHRPAGKHDAVEDDLDPPHRVPVEECPLHAVALLQERLLQNRFDPTARKVHQSQQ